MSAAALDYAVEHLNEIHLVGRVSAAPTERTLPSGDVIAQWLLVVARPTPDSSGRNSSDVLECVARTAKLRRSVRAWTAGDVVELDGSLHRRFWRTPAGTVASRYEVEASDVRRLERAS